MKITEKDENEREKLQQLCNSVRELCEKREFNECNHLIYNIMSEFPHAAEPHNLIGIVLEKTGDHSTAMKHFRAAWALDPTYQPANHNLHIYGTFDSNGKCAFDETDLPEERKPDHIKVVYDKKGIGHAVSTNKIIYDEYGVGHIVRGEN